MSAAGRPPTNPLRSWLLLLLRDVPGYGYDIRRRLAENGLEADRSTIYRALSDLEISGFLTSNWATADGKGPARRIYKLTRKGNRELARTAQEMTDAKTMLERFLSVYGQFR